MVDPKKIDTSTMFDQPLRFVPQHAYDADISNEVIITYGRLAKVLQLRNELSFTVSLELFTDVECLELFALEVKQFTDLSVRPSDDTTGKHLKWQHRLAEKFNGYGLSVDDFDDIPLQHPNNFNISI